MAKKVRSKPEDTEESKFEFPVFDEKAFIVHELELTTGMALGLTFAVVAGLLSALLSIFGGTSLTLGAPIAVGILVVVASPFLFMTLHPATREYTKTDWAGVIALEVFTWLGLWLLLAGIIGTR
ncbi:MAG TPA: hypothetical protein VGV89_05340 [Thermoplasmata archaeon]|nr:hypothetical protein [Thermoplasmata archaeon]